MPKEFSWKERTPNGGRREVRAVRHGGHWRIQSRVNGVAKEMAGGESDARQRWVYHREPEIGDLQQLLELIERKYRRRRVSWDEVREVAKLLEERRRRDGLVP